MISRDDIRASAAPLACFATIGVGWGAFGAQVPVIKAQIGASDGMFGVALLIAALGGVLAMWFAPRLDKRLRARTLPLFSLLCVSAFLIPAGAGQVWLFTFGMLACTCATGALDVIMNSRVSGIEAERSRPLMNFAHAVFSIAYGVSALSAGVMREAGLSPVVVFAVLALANLGLAAIALRDPGERVVAEDGAAPRSKHTGLLWLGGLVIMIAFIAEQATEGWSALHLERALGAGAAEGAMGPAILGFTMAAGRLSGQALIQRVSELRVLTVFSVLAALGCFVAATTGVLWVAYVGFALLGFGISVLAPMSLGYIGRMVRPQARTAAIARVTVIGYSGFFLGPPMMGFVAEAYGLATSFVLLSGIVALIALVLVPLLNLSARRSHAG